MKRSRSIRLILLGSAGLLVANCDQGPDPLAGNDFFQNEQQCAAANDASACHQALLDAQREHAHTAPVYASRQSCEDRFGLDNCTETRSTPTPDQIQSGEWLQGQPGGSWFLPAMMGYMMGRTMAAPTYMAPPPGQPRREDEQQQAATGSSTGSTGSSGGSARFGSYSSGRPVYRDVDNTVYSGKETLGQTRAFSPPRASSTSRGGFGRTGTTTVAS